MKVSFFIFTALYVTSIMAELSPYDKGRVSYFNGRIARYEERIECVMKSSQSKRCKELLKVKKNKKAIYKKDKVTRVFYR